jgi:K+ transporter
MENEPYQRKSSRTAADYYNIPTNCVIELGTKIEI